MLTASGLLGKLVDFIVDKSATHLTELPFDKRKKACRALTKLYYCVQTLDDVTAEFLATFQEFRRSGDSDARALLHSLNNHRYEVVVATNLFIDLGRELQPGLKIIDPALAQCCHTLYVGKFDFLTFMSQAIEWDRTGDKQQILVKVSRDTVESVDLNAMFAATKEALGRGGELYWSESVLDDFTAGFEEVAITWENEEAAQQLHAKLVRQNAGLREAKERLRILIKDNFTLEEVLFQTDSHPYR
ncbi:MAG TPA: hypothetical protein VG734_17390 [Lacunisphaera sp.]|nr:hypothetical protein [Lacunisphaera sp.]